MTEYSNFTLNINFAGQRDSSLPALTGDATVLAPDADGVITPHDFLAAAFGPKKSQTSDREYYDIVFTPKDPIAATRRSPVLAATNKPENFELKDINTGRLFVRTADELAKSNGAANLFGTGLLAIGDRAYYVDLPLWKRKGKANRPDFLSGNAEIHDPAAAKTRMDAKADNAASAATEPARPARRKSTAKDATPEA